MTVTRRAATAARPLVLWKIHVPAMSIVRKAVRDALITAASMVIAAANKKFVRRGKAVILYPMNVKAMSAVTGRALSQKAFPSAREIAAIAMWIDPLRSAPKCARSAETERLMKEKFATATATAIRVLSTTVKAVCNADPASNVPLEKNIAPNQKNASQAVTVAPAAATIK